MVRESWKNMSGYSGHTVRLKYRQIKRKRPLLIEELTGLVILGVLIILAFKRIGEKKDEKFDKRKW